MPCNAPLRSRRPLARKITTDPWTKRCGSASRSRRSPPAKRCSPRRRQICSTDTAACAAIATSFSSIRFTATGCPVTYRSFRYWRIGAGRALRSGSHGGHLFCLHVVAALGLGGAEVNPLCFQPFAGYSDDTIIAEGIATPPQIPGIGLKHGKACGTSSRRCSTGEGGRDDPSAAAIRSSRLARLFASRATQWPKSAHLAHRRASRRRSSL
jgi:hypothetical protein